MRTGKEVGEVREASRAKREGDFGGAAMDGVSSTKKAERVGILVRVCLRSTKTGRAPAKASGAYSNTGRKLNNDPARACQPTPVMLEVDQRTR